VIEFTRAHPDDYDAGFVDSFLELIVKLEARAAEQSVRSTTTTGLVDEVHRPWTATEQDHLRGRHPPGWG